MNLGLGKNQNSQGEAKRQEILIFTMSLPTMGRIQLSSSAMNGQGLQWALNLSK